MIWLAFLLLAAVDAVQFQGARSFQIYSTRSDWNTPAPELTHLARTCSFHIADAKPTYAVRYEENWKWRKSLKNASDGAETDLYQTLEIWKSSSGGRLVSMWDISADTVDEDELMVCSSSQGRVKALVSTHTRTNPENGKLEWRSVRSYEYSEQGKLVEQLMKFVDLDGKLISNPVLDEEDRKSLEAKPDSTSIMKMLLKFETQIGKR